MKEVVMSEQVPALNHSRILAAVAALAAEADGHGGAPL